MVENLRKFRPHHIESGSIADDGRPKLDLPQLKLIALSDTELVDAGKEDYLYTELLRRYLEYAQDKARIRSTDPESARAVAEAVLHWLWYDRGIRADEVRDKGLRPLIDESISIATGVDALQERPDNALTALQEDFPGIEEKTMQRAIAHLPERSLRRVAWLRYFDTMSMEQIAKEMTLSADEVRRQLQHVKKLLAQALDVQNFLATAQGQQDALCRMIRKRQPAYFESVVRQIPYDGQRTVALLKELDGLTMNDIAIQTNSSIKAARQLLFTARKSMMSAFRLEPTIRPRELGRIDRMKVEDPLALEAAIKKIPNKRQRECVALYELDNKSSGEVAVAMGLSTEQVRNFMFMGRQNTLRILDGESLEKKRQGRGAELDHWVHRNRQEFLAAVASLSSERHRQVITMCELRGISGEGIATKLGISIDQVNDALVRARRRLVAMMNEGTEAMNQEELMRYIIFKDRDWFEHALAAVPRDTSRYAVLRFDVEGASLDDLASEMEVSRKTIVDFLYLGRRSIARQWKAKAE